MLSGFQENKELLDLRLHVDVNFDLLTREITVGERRACYYCIDGFIKDELMEKMLQYFIGLKKEDIPQSADEMCKAYVPHVEVETEEDYDKIIKNILSGQFALIIDGFDKAIMIDARTYPARSVSEPEKDKTLRGSKDGFVETIVFNTALIRRRIRSTDLRMEMVSAGKSSKTDITLCYMDSRVDKKFLKELKGRIADLRVDALTMNQESLAECIYKGKWYNPFPKFKYTERPDAAAAQILEGNIVVLVDNSPSAMVLPTTIFDMVEEADDYYFPPITGTYLRFARFVISFMTFFVTPTFLLLMMYPEFVPEWLSFIVVKEGINIPLIWQFLILELSIDGLRLAAVNTPNMLSTPLSVIAGIVLGEFAVNSGWFNAEVMLYMAFVTVASYTTASYELGYAMKFMRIITLILTAVFGVWGYVAGLIIFVVSVVGNKTIAHTSYLYPLFPLDIKVLWKILFRHQLKNPSE